MLSEALYYGESPKMGRGGRSSGSGGGGLMVREAERSNTMHFTSATTSNHRPSSLDLKLMELIAEREDQFRIFSPPRAAAGAARRQEISRSAALQSHGGLNGSLIGVSTASRNPKLQVEDSGRSPWLLKSAEDFGGATMSNVSIAVSSRSPGGVAHASSSSTADHPSQQQRVGTTFSRPHHQPSRRASATITNVSNRGNMSTFHRHDSYAANATLSSPTKISEYGYAGRALHALQHQQQRHVDVMEDLQDYPDPYPQDNHHRHHGIEHEDPYHNGQGGDGQQGRRALRSVSSSSLAAHIDHQLEDDINEHRYDIEKGGGNNNINRHHPPQRSVSPKINFGRIEGRGVGDNDGGSTSRSVSPQEARFVQQQRQGQQGNSRSASLAVSPFSYYGEERHRNTAPQQHNAHQDQSRHHHASSVTTPTRAAGSRTAAPIGQGQQSVIASSSPPTYFSTKSMSEEEKHVVLSTIQLVLNMTSPSASETYRRGNGLGQSVALPIRNGGSGGDASSFISTAVPGRCSGGRGDYSGAGGWAAFHQRVQLLLTTSSAILQCVGGISSRPKNSFIGGGGSASSSRTGTPNNNNKLRSTSSRGGALRSTSNAGRSSDHLMTERALMILLPRAAATAAAGNGSSGNTDAGAAAAAAYRQQNTTTTTTATVAQMRGFLTLKRAHLEKVVAVLGQHFDDWDSLHPLSLEYYAVLCCADYLVNACAVWQPMGILISDENGRRGPSSSLRVLNVSRRKIAALLHDVLLERTIFGL